MTQGVYESLYKKNIDTMTGEDYKLYKAITEHRKMKKFRILTPLYCYLLPFAVIPPMVCLIAGTQFLTLSLILAAVCSATFSTAGVFSAFNSVKNTYKKNKKIVEENLTKEDLKQLKKDNIFFKIKHLYKEFEVSPRYREYLEEELFKAMADVSSSARLGTEEQIQVLQINKNQIDERIEKLRKKQQFSDQHVSDVFPVFADTDDDTKGL